MTMSSRLARAMLLTTALALPTLAQAQNDPSPPVASTPTAGEEVAQPAPDTTGEQPPEEVDISVPGGGRDIIVTGQRERNVVRSSDQVVSVLSSAEIARTGEGNIAGALGRVTGLSVVGSGFVYVRGLGDRYSLALLNGSPLPSPEPLRRVVPLDLFPSGVIASSLVQKSYSANFPGEFGGGVINLTTKATPNDPFLSIGVGVSGDSETTGNVGYAYYGSKSDWTGFDNGQRDTPRALADFLASGQRLSAGTFDSGPLAGSLVNGRTAVVQRMGNTPANSSANLSGGKTFGLGDMNLGVIAAAGYSSRFTTRQPRQQTSLSSDLSTLESDFLQLNTDQRVVVNGLLGLGLEFGQNRLRWTNLFIRDTIKQARLALGQRQENVADVLQQRTAWYERQLINTQLVGEFDVAEGLKLELRGGYANSQREAPFESIIEYVRTNAASDPFGNQFINVLNRQRGDARVIFSDLNEDLWSGGTDLSYVLTPSITATVGGAYTDTRRTSSRREFFFDAGPNLPQGVALLRPDLLLSPGVVDAFGIQVLEADEGNPAFLARLRNPAAYAKANVQITDELSLDAGVRYEKATQRVDPIQVFNDPGASTAATLTWQFQPEMQVRLSASKTIARPQFRELINQPYFDPDSNRPYRGNPLLVDSRLTNAEARYEWYFARGQRVSLSGFYKSIDKPIESFLTGSELITSFANAPKATLYGAEVEVQKNFDLAGLVGDGNWFSERRLVLIGNYTFTKSKLKVRAGDTTAVFGASSTIAGDYFRDGAPLTGQSDHLVNLQLGLEHPDHLSQFTVLVSYASERVSSRGLNGTPPQPDVIEKPGLQLDFVAREGLQFMGKEIELKFEARNITGRGHIEFQQSGSNRIEVNTYDVGRSFALSASLKL
jgi:outer membrane receptor protein involved in Fe transport